jgi:hypothetical protein
MSDDYNRFVLERDGFQHLLDALVKRGYRVVGPTVREGAIVYAPDHFIFQDRIVGSLLGTWTYCIVQGDCSLPWTRNFGGGSGVGVRESLLLGHIPVFA